MPPNFSSRARFVLGLWALIVPMPALADTSATLATAINIPKGPASIEGFGRAYEVSPASGLPSLEYPIAVPPGRAGHAPALALHYHAGTGAGVLGLGWSLDLPAIERSPRAGIPRPGEPAVWTLRHLGDGEELTEAAPGVYRQRIEQGSPIIVRTLPGGAMSAVTVDGTGYLFGLTDEARLVADAGPVRLELSAITDVHGNHIDFSYTREAGSDAPLLAAITWNDGRARVVFDYEARPDIVTSRALGVRVALAHRLATLRTEAAGEPVRTTTLTYARSVEAPSSRLASIATVAADGAALPTWRMTYTGEAATPDARDMPDAPALDPTAEGRAWVDVDGDALPDLLDGEPGAWRMRKNIGGQLAATWTMLASPAAALGPKARFADLTGDGVGDLLAEKSPGELWSYVGGGADPFGHAEPTPVDLSFDLSDPRVALADMNADGRVDVLRHDDEDGWIWLRRREGAGYEAAEAVPPPPPGMRLGDPGVQLADVDGDRIPDLVRIITADSRILVAPGAGLGLFDEPAELHSVPTMQETDRFELADMNGDGAADLVRIGAVQLRVWLAQLDGSMAEAMAADWPALEADEVVLVTDIDGSGTPDVLRIDTDGSQPWRAFTLFPDRPGLLARFENGLGYVREHTYRPAAQLAAEDAAAGAPWATTPPEPMPVLTETREDDGAGWTSTLRRGLRDGWYDPTRGEFRGFAELTDRTTGDPYTEAATVTRQYDLGQTDDARGLQLLAAETRSPHGVLVREAHTLAVDTPAAGVRAVRRVATDTYHVEAGPESAAVRVRTEWDHDDWGNVIEERALGRVDRYSGADIPGDERITTTTYATPRAEDGPRTRVAEQVLADADGVQLTATRTYYDGAAEEGLALGELDARGVVARTLTWTLGDTWIASLRQTVDPHGNVTRVRDAEDGTLVRIWDAAGLFPVEERLQLAAGEALVTTAEWDARSGHPLAVTSPSGATTRAVYDGLGRLVAEVEPGDSVALPTTRHVYHLDGAAARPSVITELRRMSGEPDVDVVALHLDGLGRPRLRVTQDDTGDAAILAEARIYSDVGALAEVIEGQPLTADALAPGAVIDIAADWPRSTRHADALGRVDFTRDADGRETTATYGPLWALHRDHEDLHPEPPYEDTPERITQDGLGRTVAREALLQGRALRHAYTHDAAGRLALHVDPAGHNTTWEHDGAGRLTRVQSPDAGEVRQRFDDVGRLVERRDATGARITWAYDPLGRLLRERAFSPTGEPVGEVRQTYDGEGPHARGQLARVDDDAGSVTFVYDARGRIVSSTRTFTAADGPVTLTAGQVYDAQDRIVREIYPDGSTLDHDYSPRGLERPLEGFVTRADYDALARWRSITLAPGAELHRDLDHAGRVLGQHVTAGSRALLHLAHRYDAAGQLAETQDDLAAEGLTLAQTFAYDDLRRLVGHSAAGKLQTWRYSDDGNLLAQGGHTLGYDEDRPHAAVTLGDQALDYDAAGRLADVAGDGPLAAGAWSFDPHGRVRSFTAADGRRVEHVYGYTGERAIRREYDADGRLAGEVLYFTRNLEIRGGQLVRWVFFAGERIAESPVPLPAGGFPELPVESLHVALPRPVSGLLWLVLLLLALTLRVLASPLRRPFAATGFALALSATTLSCHHGADRALAPDEHTRFHVADRLGSAALVLDHRGRVVSRDVADPYGAPRIAWRADEDAAGPAYRFTGKEDDALSGAIAMGARHYLPQLGRWASPDLHYLVDRPDAALETPGEANPYGYVGGNPVTFTDPTGRKGLAHGSENRPGVLDSYPDNDGPAFANRMAAVARDRALAEYRQAQLASMAYGVLDAALTGLDWAMTASDVADMASLAMGPPALGIKASKQAGKLAIRRARRSVRQYADDAIQAAKNAAESLRNAVNPGRARRNAHLAGKKHPETGIPFDGDARPDFSKVSVKEVKIEYANPVNRKKDRAAANKAAGFAKTPKGHDWHHDGDGRMQLVPHSVHGKTGHDGPLSPH